MSDPIESLKAATETLQKALQASVTNSLAKREALARTAPAFTVSDSITDVVIVGRQGTGTSFEPMIVKASHVEAPQPEMRKSEDLASCVGCGYVYKSTSNCYRCTNAASMTEALPFHKR